MLTTFALNSPSHNPTRLRLRSRFPKHMHLTHITEIAGLYQVTRHGRFKSMYLETRNEMETPPVEHSGWPRPTTEF